MLSTPTTPKSPITKDDHFGGKLKHEYVIFILLLLVALRLG